MQQLMLFVPTYYGSCHAQDQADAANKTEFDEPNVPILVYSSAGARVVLGTHDYEDLEKPDIQIERRPNGWAIFLHPLGGSDPCGYIYFIDDGRSFLIKDLAYPCTPEIVVLEPGEDVPDIDDLDWHP